MGASRVAHRPVGHQGPTSLPISPPTEAEGPWLSAPQRSTLVPCTTTNCSTTYGLPRELRNAIPGPWSAFVGLHEAALADGALTGTVKELMALAISVVERCDGCIAAHAPAARRRATPAQVAEAISVALLMGGGPATVYGPRAWAAYQEFADQRLEQPAVAPAD